MRTAKSRVMRDRARRAMAMRAGSVEEREQLEQFLEWRRATGRGQRKTRGRSLAYLVAIVVLVAIDLVLLVALSGVMRDGRRALAPEPPDAPAVNSTSPPSDAQPVVPPSAPSNTASVAGTEPTAPSTEPDSPSGEPNAPSREANMPGREPDPASREASAANAGDG